MSSTDDLEATLGKAMQLIDKLNSRVNELENPKTTLKDIGYGTVLADKNNDSKHLLVHLHEEFPNMEGDLSSLHTSVEYSGTDIHGESYNHTLQFNSGVKAIWLEKPNQATADCLVAGQQVKMYQAGDGDKYYWEALGRQKEKMRAEKKTYVFNASSAPKDTDINVTPDNHYVFEINGQDGHITLTTSKDNGEACTFTVQLDTKKGAFSISDSLNNHFNIDSVNANFLYQNTKGGKISVSGKDMVLEGETLHASFTNIILNGDTQVVKTLTTASIKNSGDITTATIGDVPVANYQHS